MRLDDLPWDKPDDGTAQVSLGRKRGDAWWRLVVYRSCQGRIYDVYIDRVTSSGYTVWDHWSNVDPMEAQCLVYKILASYSGGNNGRAQ